MFHNLGIRLAHHGAKHEAVDAPELLGVALGTGEEVVDSNGAIATVQETLDPMGTDKPTSAGHQDGLGFAVGFQVEKSPRPWKPRATHVGLRQDVTVLDKIDLD